ncbi:unnamed protein product [Cuscuta europaea]|nr:unnamed protein product [Cuscuta europaea]
MSEGEEKLACRGKPENCRLLRKSESRTVARGSIHRWAGSGTSRRRKLPSSEKELAAPPEKEEPPLSLTMLSPLQNQTAVSDNLGRTTRKMIDATTVASSFFLRNDVAG